MEIQRRCINNILLLCSRDRTDQPWCHCIGTDDHPGAPDKCNKNRISNPLPDPGVFSSSKVLSAIGCQCRTHYRKRQHI